jgi:hypothetical protein
MTAVVPWVVPAKMLLANARRISSYASESYVGQVLMGHLVAVEVVILFEVSRVTTDCLVPHGNVAGREEMPSVLGNHGAQLVPRLDERGIDSRLHTRMS